MKVCHFPKLALACCWPFDAREETRKKKKEKRIEGRRQMKKEAKSEDLRESHEEYRG